MYIYIYTYAYEYIYVYIYIYIYMYLYIHKYVYIYIYTQLLIHMMSHRAALLLMLKGVTCPEKEQHASMSEKRSLPASSYVKYSSSGMPIQFRRHNPCISALPMSIASFRHRHRVSSSVNPCTRLESARRRDL